jgi:hypothetical protein
MVAPVSQSASISVGAPSSLLSAVYIGTKHTVVLMSTISPSYTMMNARCSRRLERFYQKCRVYPGWVK